MNAKEPQPGEYYYITLEFEDKYEDKIIRLIEIVGNDKCSGISFMRTDDEFRTLMFEDSFPQYGKCRIIWLKQWKPNWFYRMIGY